MVCVNTAVTGEGRHHPLQSALAASTVVLGLVAVLGLALGSWNLAMWVGLSGAVVAAYDEFIAQTSGERRVILAGFLLCLVAIAVSMSNGALF